MRPALRLYPPPLQLQAPGLAPHAGGLPCAAAARGRPADPAKQHDKCSAGAVTLPNTCCTHVGRSMECARTAQAACSVDSEASCSALERRHYSGCALEEADSSCPSAHPNVRGAQEGELLHALGRAVGDVCPGLVVAGLQVQPPLQLGAQALQQLRARRGMAVDRPGTRCVVRATILGLADYRVAAMLPC